MPSPSPRLTCPKAADYLAAGMTSPSPPSTCGRLNLTGEIPSLRLSERKP